MFGELERGDAIVTPNELVFAFEGFTSVPVLVKSVKKCERESARRRTHGQMQTGFIICRMLYAIAMGQIITRHKCRVTYAVDLYA